MNSTWYKADTPSILVHLNNKAHKLQTQSILVLKWILKDCVDLFIL